MPRILCREKEVRMSRTPRDRTQTVKAKPPAPAVPAKKKTTRTRRSKQTRVVKKKAVSYSKRMPLPKILLIGAEHKLKKIAPVLDDLMVDFIIENEVIRAFDTHGDSVSAVVLVEPLPKIPLVRACHIFTKDAHTSDIPLFVIVPNQTSDSTENQLYKAGVTAVFEWPKERPELPRLIMRMVDIESKRTPDKTDDALLQAIKVRLKAGGDVLGKRLLVIVIDGVVFLTGQVDALWKKRLAKSMISEIPGVRDVILRRLVVSGEKLSDKVIEARIRAVIKHATALDLETLDISVANGKVVLKGPVENYRDRKRIEEMVCNLKCIRDVENVTIVSSALKKRAKHLAKRIKDMIFLFHPKAKVKISVFGGVAVLRGSVDKRSTALAAEYLAVGEIGILRVVNKLKVIKPRKGRRTGKKSP
jgi:osmotically-inducible protein OsmY